MVLEKVNQEEFWQMSQEEIFARLKGTYQEQKLGKVGRYFSRLSSIFILLLGMFFLFDDDILHQILAGIGIIYEIYRLIKPHGKDEKHYNEFKIVSNLVQEYKDKILDTDKEKPNERKNIYIVLSDYLYHSRSFKITKAIAYIPVLNMFFDEMSPYTPKYSALLKMMNALKNTLKIAEKE
ncbi:hypothetical protein [Fusobacterium pseudoperiodonticum]|jgi:hypothetical protein|uniref:hypothetical protein n=1 Tax=Fusobacterium pseudoperiodonticum TaxID=2663009 RepID=UPI0030CC745C